MKIEKEKLGFDPKRFMKIIVVISIALPVSLMGLVRYRNSSFDLIGMFAKANNILQQKSQDFTDSRNDSSPPSSISDAKVVVSGHLPLECGNRNGSKSDSLRPHPKLLNGTSAPGFQKESRNVSSQPTKMRDDIMLDGLLAPGFDEASCISRHQSSLFRKSSPHKPSSYLLSKLRGYEELHRHCGPNTKSYNRAFKKLKSRPGNEKGCKYLVWVPVNGLGNRMISLASTFLYALLTHRVLLVDFGTDMVDLFCEPFPNSSWILPRHFPHRNDFGSPDRRHAGGFGSMLRRGIINDSHPSSYAYLNLDHTTYDLDRQCFYCNPSPSPLQKIPWLFLLSDQYFAPSFFLTSTFKQQVEEMFPVKDSLFHLLGRYLFHPSNQAWGLISRFYQAYLAKADERIGLQVRIYNITKSPVDLILDQILGCTMKEKVLPQVDVKTYAAATNPSKNQRSKAILITSLCSGLYENISNLYWARPTVTGEVVGVFQPSHEEFQHFGDNMHNMKAWAEMYLLSLSDVLVTSAWSTFGYVAQGLGGLKPWIIYKARLHNIPNPSCVRDLSMEPCFHFPPVYDCKTKAKMDPGALLPYLRHCEDLNWGVKLVRDHQHQQ